MWKYENTKYKHQQMLFTSTLWHTILCFSIQYSVNNGIQFSSFLFILFFSSFIHLFSFSFFESALHYVFFLLFSGFFCCRFLGVCARAHCYLIYKTEQSVHITWPMDEDLFSSTFLISSSIPKYKKAIQSFCKAVRLSVCSTFT